MIIFYLTLFLFILGHSFILRDLDYDFFARLIVGKTFFQTGDVMKWDFLSYTPTHEFIDHEWGSSLIFYTLQNNFGDIGLLFFKAIMYFLIFFIITQTIKLRTPKTKLNFLPFCLSFWKKVFSFLFCGSTHLRELELTTKQDYFGFSLLQCSFGVTCMVAVLQALACL